MNRDKPEKIDQYCNVCGSTIEVGSAWSRCSNRDCITRHGDALNEAPYDDLPSLDTDATDEEIAAYWEQRARLTEDDGPSQEAVDDAVEEAYRAFKNAPGYEEATEKNGAVKALLPLSSYSGWGALRMAVDE
jgi:hypothetical protein